MDQFVAVATAYFLALLIPGVDFFLIARAAVDLTGKPRAARTPWVKNLMLGFASGLFNPRNALFYVSLAAAVSQAGPASLVLFGLEMLLALVMRPAGRRWPAPG